MLHELRVEVEVVHIRVGDLAEVVEVTIRELL
jgi:hypothetical protein